MPVSHAKSDLDKYVENLSKLQAIREFIGGKVDLPQICVVGDQSSGKSSMLEGLTGINLPVGAGVCTRNPILTHCRRDETLSKDVYEVQIPPWFAATRGRAFGTVGGAGVKTALDDLQKSESSPSPMDLGEYDADTPGAYEQVDIFELAEIVRAIQGQNLDRQENPIVSSQEIRIRATGPNQMDLVVIDLPGIINADEGRDTTRELICNYIEKPQTLILLVSEAKQDEQLASAVDLAKKFDPHLLRTMRILTKFDIFDSDLAKEVYYRFFFDLSF